MDLDKIFKVFLSISLWELCVLLHNWTKGEVGAPLNRLSPPVKYFYSPFQGGASFFVLFCYAFMHACLLMPCGHLLGKGWLLGSRLWCLIVTLSLSHWYPQSGVVLDCIHSWFLPFFFYFYSCQLDLRGFVGRIYVGDHKTLLHTKL